MIPDLVRAAVLIYLIVIGCSMLFIGYFEGGGLIWIGITILLVASLLSPPYLARGYKETRGKVEQKKQAVEAYRQSLNWYDSAKIIFKYSNLLLPVSIIVVLLFPNSIFFRESPFFSESLILLVNLVGFVFIVIIFMIQNVTQSYSSNLSKEIFRDPYLRKIFVVLLFITGYNLTGLYFELGWISQFFSYILSMISFAYIISLVLLTSHYLAIGNTIIRAESRIKSKLSKDNLYKYFDEYKNKDEEFIQELGNDCLLITNTAIEAINNNDHEIVNQCINSLENIGIVYLGLLESPAEDDFITELNKQFELLINKTSEKYTTQKYLDNLYNSLGTLARKTYTTTYNSSQTGLWLRSLKNIVKQIHSKMDLTDAVGGSIQEINRTAIIAIQTNEPNTQYDPGIFSRHIDDIAEIGLNYNSGFVVRHCLDAYTWQFICRVKCLTSEEIYYRSHDLKNSIREITDLSVKAIHNQGIRSNSLNNKFFGQVSFMILLRCYGLYSLTPQHALPLIAFPTSPPEEIEFAPQPVRFDNPGPEQELIEGLEGVVEFLDEIAEAFRGANLHEVYSGYVEFAFIVFSDLHPRYADKSTLVNRICRGFASQIHAECVASNRNEPDFDVEKHLLDFLILATWMYRRDDQGMYEIMEHFVDLYDNLVNDYGKNDAEWLYRRLKLIGCLIKPLSSVTHTQNLIEGVLIRDYEQPGHNLALSAAPIGLRLEYPGEEMGNGIKGLSHRQIWRGLPQQVALPQQIERNLYDNIVSRCSDYNDYLESQSS